MFRALWYIVKVLVVVGIAVFLMVQPGEVVLHWNDYQVTVQLGYAMVALLIGFVLVSMFSEMVTRLSLWPANLARARAERRRTKGYRALMQSLSAAATGDQQNAYYLAHRAQKFLPEEESGLPLLLQAQAMSKKGDVADQDEPYKILIKNADTALLGIQGLTQNAILVGNFEKALLLARKAFAENPKNLSLVKAVYDLELKNKLWNDALVTLNKHKKTLGETAEQDRKVIYIVLGDMAKEQGRREEAAEFYKRAYKDAPDFVPANLRYIQSFIEIGATRKALSLLEKAWKREAHPDYVLLWEVLTPEQKPGKPNVKFRWFQWVAEFQPNSEVAQLALAKAAIEEQLWGEARIALVQAEKHGKSAEIYKLWVKLEEQTTNKPEVVRQWLDRAYQAAPCGAWICIKTKRQFAAWQAIVEPENLFNTLVWTVDVNAKPTAFITGDIISDSLVVSS